MTEHRLNGPQGSWLPLEPWGPEPLVLGWRCTAGDSPTDLAASTVFANNRREFIFLGDSDSKEYAAMWETQVLSLSQEDPLEKGMATHSSILAWRIPWTEESGGLQSMGSQRAGYGCATNTHTHTLWYQLIYQVTRMN